MRFSTPVDYWRGKKPESSKARNLMNLPLKKTLSAIMVMVTILLAGLLALGIRQYQLHRHHQEISRQTEQLIFQFSLIREQIIETMLSGRPGQFEHISRELEGFHANVTRIMENVLISDEYKLTFVSQADIRGLALLMRTMEKPLTPDAAEHLNQVVRSLGERLRVFDRLVVQNANRQLLAFQVMVIGILALTVVGLVGLLTLGYRRLAVPLFTLGGHIRAVREKKRSSVPMLEGWQEVRELASLIDETFQENRLLARNEARQRQYLLMTGQVLKLLVETRGTESMVHGLNKALLSNSDYCLAWIGVPAKSASGLAVAAQGSTFMGEQERRECMTVLAVDEESGESQNPAHCAFQSGRAIVCHDTLASFPKGSLRNTPLAVGTLSCASFPIRRGEQILGVVNLYSLEPESFTSEEVELLSRLLDLAALVLKECDRTAARQAATASGRILASSEAAGEMALEINNLCNGIINYAQLLTDDIGDKVPEEQNMLLARIIREGERIATLVDPLLGRQPEGTETMVISGKKERLGPSPILREPAGC
jgi:hypothetical protein